MDEDEYVETSDLDELEESRGLFYPAATAISAESTTNTTVAEILANAASPRQPKRRKTFHDPENGELIRESFQRHYDAGETSHSPTRTHEEQLGFLDSVSSQSNSQSPETEAMDPLPVLFEDSTGSGADTPLTFPSSPTREDNDGRKSVNGDLEGDGLEDWELSQDPLDLINCQEEEYRMSPLPPSSIPRTRPPSEHLEPTDGLFELDENKHSTVPSPSQVYPILPQPSHSPAPFPLPLHSKSPSPEPQQANTDGDAALAATLHAAASTQPIRALRQRQPHQQRPYTYDLLQYKRQMKRVPEAIVKMRHIEQDLRDHRDQRRKDGYRSEEESQEQEYRPPSEQEEDPRRSGQQRASLVVSATGAGDALIPDLPESSDDEEINDTRREAKKAEKERKKKERETERAEKEKERAEREKKSRLKSFPIKEKQQSRKRPRSLSAETRKSATRNATPGPSNRRHTRTPSPLPQPSPSDVDEVPMWDAWKSDDAPPSSHNVSDRDYRRSGSFDDHNLSPGPIPVSPMQHLSPSPLRKISRSRSRSHSTPHVPDLEVDSDYSGSASSRADLSESNAKKRKQLKALGRMVPRFMFPALGLNSDGDPISQPFNRKGMGKQQQIVNVSSDEEDADVRPGVARVRMGKGDLRPVMGDSESESEGGRGQSPLVPFDHHLDSELLHDPSPSKSYDVYNPLAIHFPRPKSIQRLSPVRRKLAKDNDVIEVLSSSSSLSSDDSIDETDIDDEDITSFLQGNVQTTITGASRMRIDYLIDYMLAKNARIRGSSSKRKKGGKSKDHGRQPKTKSINDLPRARRVGSGSHDHHKGNAKLLSTSKPRSHGSPSGGYKLNIVRPGQGHGKQTLLSFTKTRKSRTRDDHVQRHPGYEGRGGSDDEAADDADDEDVEMLSVEDKFEDEAHQLSKKDDQKLTWKQRLKKRKEAERMHGVYTHIAEPGTRLRANAGDQVPFESGSKRISSTSRKRNSGKQRKKSNRKDLVWDMEQDDNDDLRQALAPPPSSQPRVNSSSAPKRVSVPHPLNNKDTIGANLEPKQGSESRSHVVRTDSDFALLLPGRTFGSKTYIKRGMLYELIQIMQPANTSASTPAPILHPKYNAPHLPITFSLSNPLSDFLRDLPILCEHLGEFVTGLPDMDEERVGREWRITMRGVEEVLTGFLKGEMNDIDLQKVHNTVENALKGLILQMGAADFTKMTIDVMTLDVAWFAVELGVRAGFRLPSSNLLLDASKLLVGLLLGVDSGLKGAMVQMRDLTRELNDLNSVVQRGAELWVFLIFVLGPKGNHRSPDESHPLWDIVTAELERSTSVAQWSLVSTDAIWQTISNLCALSQFSEHGLCKEKPTIPEHWKIVHFALKSARLQIDPDNERDLSPATLRTKDRYTKLIVTRCFFLVTRWGWTVENDILDKLSKMFMSRKYRNLEHEDADFPEFLRTQRWESCFDYSKRDSAFVLFLKLAVQRKHIVTRSGKPERFIDNQLKKLLSFITPMGSLVSFSKANPAQGNELSMLYNRMAATAVGLHLLPSEYRAKVQQARKYIDFVKSDDTSRVACIRSLMYLSQMIVLEKLPLADTEVNPWYKDIVDVLIKEYKTLSTNAHGDSLNRVMLLLTLVPGSLRHILNAYNDPETGPQYPDLSLLDVIQRIGNDSSIMENINTAQEVEKVLRTFLSIRDKIIPAPQLPPLEPLLENNTDEDLHESQGCYGDMDIDIDDPTVLALLAGDINEPSSTERMDSKKAKVLSPLTWVLYRYFQNLLRKLHSGLVPSSGFLGLVDRWIDTWLQFASVAMTHSQNMTWTSLCLDGRNTWEKDGNIDFACRRRIDLRVAFNILTRTPMSYQDDKLKYYFIETLFYALVPGQVTIQHDFVSWLLSIDGLRHSLLRKLPVLLPPRPEIHTFSIEDFVSVREQLLGGILDNIEHSLHDEENNTGIRTVLGESPTNKRYAEFLVNYLTTLKETWMNLPHGSKERQDYEHKCKEITKLIYETHSRIGTLARLGKWDVWRRGLD